jgi:hypothetical protein
MQYANYHFHHFRHPCGNYLALPRLDSNGHLSERPRALYDAVQVALQRVFISTRPVADEEAVYPSRHLNAYEYALLRHLFMCHVELYGINVYPSLGGDCVDIKFLDRVLQCATITRYRDLTPKSHAILLALYTSTTQLIIPCFRKTVILAEHNVFEGDDAVTVCEEHHLEPIEDDTRFAIGLAHTCEDVNEYIAGGT